jgi:hypothetical protein
VTKLIGRMDAANWILAPAANSIFNCNIRCSCGGEREKSRGISVFAANDVGNFGISCVGFSAGSVQLFKIPLRGFEQQVGLCNPLCKIALDLS